MNEKKSRIISFEPAVPLKPENGVNCDILTDMVSKITGYFTALFSD